MSRKTLQLKMRDVEAICKNVAANHPDAFVEVADGVNMAMEFYSGKANGIRYSHVSCFVQDENMILGNATVEAVRFFTHLYTRSPYVSVYTIEKNGFHIIFLPREIYND